MSGEWKVWVVACAMVIGIYAYTAPLGKLQVSVSNPADTYCNLQVQGFRAGQLSLKKEVPAGFARLADPYDPVANAVYQGFGFNLRDLSYYKGRLYMYFGVTPALILFWPFVALTGHYLFDRQAVTVFCALGALASVGLLRALWRRYFSEVSAWVLAVCALALGLASGLPTMLPRSNVHEVTSSCGYMLTMLALGAVWCALHEPERKLRWLAAASAAYGLAVAARPSLLFGAVILLIPVAQAWPKWQRVWRLLAAATVPIALIGLGLMLYNTRRFDNPFEFGWHYQLAGKRQLAMQSFSLRYLWYHFQVYFLEPPHWCARFPFVQQITVRPLPADGYGIDSPLGILTNIPLVWLALAAPLAWHRRSGQEASVLRLFVGAIAVLFLVSALTVALFCASNIRYTVDFLPALILLAVVGILSLERVLANQLVWRRVARWGWGVLLVFSVVFNMLTSIVGYGQTGCGLATVLVVRGRIPEGIEIFERALRIVPDFVDGHYGLGVVLWQSGKVSEAIQEYEYALRLKPDYTDAHVGLGAALVKVGRFEDAVRHCEEALRIKPDNPEAHLNLGSALVRQGRMQEAITHFNETLRIEPDYAKAYYNRAVALEQVGRLPEALADYEEALRLKLDDARTHFHLGQALEKLGRADEAADQYEQASRTNPADLETHVNLGNAFLRMGKMQEAVGEYEQVLRINPGLAEAHGNLGAIFQRIGKLPEAVAEYELALQRKPDFVEAHFNLGLAFEKLGRTTEAIQQYEQALKLRPDFLAAKNASARLQAGQ
jgi:tetratricopeptide (TPR) repeat protein